jgi:NAD(P)H-quinone oxidoreductase subunit M
MGAESEEGSFDFVNEINPDPTRLHMENATLLKSTTRHIRIFAAKLDQDGELVPSSEVLTLDIDPDNEFSWSEDALQKVYRQFDELVEASSGAELTDYNLRRIGSDLEHLVRSLLQKGEISYNLNARVTNYSMGLPRMEAESSK